MNRSPVFWDVDTQHDFMDEDGKLAVPGAAEIVPNLKRLTDFALQRRIPILASADAHGPDDPEFDQFGRHCVAGTPGQGKIEATVTPTCETADPWRLGEQLNGLLEGGIQQIVIEKQDLDVFSVPLAQRALSALGPDRVYVYGVATEYCVLRAVLGLVERGYDVTVVRDAVRGVNEENAREAIEQMRAAGAKLADTRTVLASLSEE